MQWKWRGWDARKTMKQSSRMTSQVEDRFFRAQLSLSHWWLRGHKVSACVIIFEVDFSLFHWIISAPQGTSYRVIIILIMCSPARYITRTHLHVNFSSKLFTLDASGKEWKRCCLQFYWERRKSRQLWTTHESIYHLRSQVSTSWEGDRTFVTFISASSESLLSN